MVGIAIARKKKCIVVLSGGPDSVTVAYWAKKRGYEVYALTFRYGQIADKEVKHATMISQSLGIPIKVIDLSSLKDVFVGVTSLCDRNIKMTSDFSQPIIVPFRNAIFLSAAVAYAISVGAIEILYGAQGSDEAFYPDCRTKFYKAFEKAARLGTDTNISIKAPLSKLTKAEVIKLGAKLGVPFHLTWSCYLDMDKHCGKCESCINRRKAFREAAIPDPTEYAE
ncbi:7-cyano-7-deazaguanine synthase QueC [Candidatus Bathyarchaeota archaeon]|nr:7-cyano-7-deazaguanine synthase QueC [Candidatus Bathyarchaeota archaeon]